MRAYILIRRAIATVITEAAIFLLNRPLCLGVSQCDTCGLYDRAYYMTTISNVGGPDELLCDRCAEAGA